MEIFKDLVLNLLLRWYRRPKKVEKLSLATDHLHAISRLSRAVVAELVLGEAVLPLIRTYLDIGIFSFVVLINIEVFYFGRVEENVFAMHQTQQQDRPATLDEPNKCAQNSHMGQEVMHCIDEEIEIL